VTSDNSHYSIVKDLFYYFRPSVETSTFISCAIECSSFNLAQVSQIQGRRPGGGEGIRTPDPRVANAVLCQLSYTPDNNFRFWITISDLKKIRNLKSAIRNRERLVAGAGFEPATFGL
jgi:hypothetical protein